ncbi:protein arginine N-methyltransferase [Acanthopleuribacter pedis]|uniref:Tetratricopeptide repeat protein n=1 Tax=Acanthopleuribacter pedis TaxID=442870 RepID=A0A8J7U8P1_9BACT|nr:protein arginine N-methyltransferase [Acanthopleuribacter pedis]MBO1322776.1 hypothetical protein [Acanthopleuribacter pedis]
MNNGLSLRNALRGKDQAACDATLAASACLVCGNSGFTGSLDWGPLKKHRQLLFYEVVKTCVCGFQNRLFVIANDVERRRAPALKTSEAALADALARGNLDPVELDESVAHIMALVFAKKSAEALARAEAAVSILSDHPRAWYNLAWLYGEMGRLQEGIVAYQVSLSLAPDSIESLYNQAFLMAEIGDAGRAVLNLARIISIAERNGDQQLVDDMHKLVGETMKVKDRSVGPIGTVEVVEDDLGRRVLIDQQNQGGALFSPSAALYLASLPEASVWTGNNDSEAQPLALEPGPVPDSFFSTAWTALALQHANVTGLALGLGSGTGLLALLAAQPKLKITVVEVSPEVVAQVRRWFPLLRWFEDSGRLTIEIDEGGAWLDGHNLDPYAFLITDVFCGEAEVPDVLTASRLEKCRRAEVDVWLNLIVDPKKERLALLVRRFEAAGLPLAYAGLSCPPLVARRISAHWILATRAPDFAAMKRHQPFGWCLPDPLNLFHSYYRLLGEWCFNAAEIKRWFTLTDMSQ